MLDWNLRSFLMLGLSNTYVMKIKDPNFITEIQSLICRTGQERLVLLSEERGHKKSGLCLIVESPRLEKTSKIIQSNRAPTADIITKLLHPDLKVPRVFLPLSKTSTSLGWPEGTMRFVTALRDQGQSKGDSSQLCPPHSPEAQHDLESRGFVFSLGKRNPKMPTDWDSSVGKCKTGALHSPAICCP